MFFKIFKKIFRNKFTTIITLLIIFTAGYFGYLTIGGSDEAARYTVAAAGKGTIIVSVSGSGQVSSLDQVDITPKVSGELISLYLSKDQTVQTGQVVAILDSTSAEETVRDAELSLEDAKYALTQAQKDGEDIKTTAERSLADAYENGYDSVSTIFFKLSDYMEDLKDVLGTEDRPQEYITGYELILGENSLFIQNLLEDYELADDLFDKDFILFRDVSRQDSRDTIYQLINDTIETAEAISQALDSARHMYDAISLCSYQHLPAVASQINTMQPKIESDVSAVYSSISSLQNIKDTIDDTNENTPEEIEVAQRAIQSAQNTVVKKEKALADAKKELAKYSVLAPFSGAIAAIGDAKTGDTVSANTVLATLITTQKIAEISLNEIDVAAVKVGQKATITFDALPDLTITGKISEVDVTGEVSQGVVSYGVKISFDTEDESVKSGMSAAVDIITDVGQDVLVLPNSAVKSQGDTYYVELVEVSSEEMRQQLLNSKSGITFSQEPKVQAVEIGLTGDTSTEIVSGLKEGDIVISSTVNQNTTQTQSTQSFREPAGEMQMFFR